MNSLRQTFRFPKKLWQIASCAAFLYLFFGVRIGEPGKFPVDFTAWKAIVSGEIWGGILVSLLWLIFALGAGAFVSAVLGIIGQLFLRPRQP